MRSALVDQRRADWGDTLPPRAVAWVRARGVVGMRSRASGVARLEPVPALCAYFPRFFSIVHVFWTCDAGARGSASLPSTWNVRSTVLKFEFIDVLWGDDYCRAENDLTILADRIITKTARRKS